MSCKDSAFKYQSFPNGLSLEEGVQRASTWWNDVGRNVIPQMLGEEQPLDSAAPGYGIMSGVEYMSLTTAEQHKVLMAWYKTKGCEL